MKGIVMKLSDVIMEVQETLECERKSYDDGACQDDNIKGWIEALEYTQGLLNKVTTTEVKTLPEPTYNGYTNKPTWSIMSWINNDAFIYKTIMNKMKDDQVYHRNNGRQFIKGDNRGSYKIDLAEYLCHYFDDYKPNAVGVKACINDILGYTMSIINWEEIAEHLIDDYEEEMEVK